PAGARLAAAGPGPAASGVPASPAASALPLARVLQPSFAGRPGAIQRDLMADAPSGAAESPPAPAAAGPSTLPAAGAAAPEAPAHTADDKTEELTERILHRVLRALAVEGERRGLRPWL